MQGGAGGNACENALATGKQPACGIGMFFGNGHHGIIDVRVQQFGDKIGSNALQPVASGAAAGEKGIEMFTNSEVKDLETVVVPIQPDNLRFVEWIGNTLKITCYEFLAWGKEVELYLDGLSMEWLDG